MSFEYNNTKANTPQPPVFSGQAPQGGLKVEVKKIENANRVIKSYLPRLTKPKLVRDTFVHLLVISLIVTPLTVLISNLFLDFYYKIPESPKYVKVAGSQVALKVNTQVSQNIEINYQKKLAQINPQGFQNGVEVNQSEGVKESIDVKGSIISIKTNYAAGTVNAPPLELSKIALKGMQSSYQVGNKYYDVDLKVSGSQRGLIANKTGYEQVDKMTLFAASLGLIEQADQVLRIDLEKFLNQSNNREQSLSSYLRYMQNIDTSIRKTQAKVDAEIARLSNIQSLALAKRNQTETNFFSALNKFNQTESYENLDQFVIDSQDEIDKKAHLQAMSQIQKYFAAYLPLLTSQIEAVEANREPLVHGIKVVAFRDVDLGLIEVR